jgi:thymidylate synthase
MGLIGSVHQSNNHGQFTVVREYNVGKNLRYDCKFHKTGYVATGVTKQNITKTKQVRDLYFPSVCNVGFVGDSYEKHGHEMVKKLVPTWQGMLSRCFVETDSNYHSYGGRGVTVAPRWFNLSNFIEDVQLLDGWSNKMIDWSGYTLDKDFYRTKLYSRCTCLWLDLKNQEMLVNDYRIKATNIETGKVAYGMNSNDLTISLPFLKPQHIISAINGYQASHGGWKFEKVNSSAEYIRVNQLKNLINGLKTDPHSRRHVIDAWNPAEINDMALPPCHVMSQFHVNSKNELSCLMTQRSVDSFLGLSFNIASYAIFTHMLAQVCNLKVGELIMSLGDVHIYHNHFDQVREQLSREPLELPQLWLNPDIDDIEKFTMDDIQLDGYQSHGTIKAPMAV